MRKKHNSTLFHYQLCMTLQLTVCAMHNQHLILAYTLIQNLCNRLMHNRGRYTFFFMLEFDLVLVISPVVYEERFFYTHVGA